MALRPGKPLKEVKKASYYVWFLGAKESNGLRGDEHIRPAVRHLIDREMDVEPLKVTLQVSGKGLKIIQNESLSSSSSTARSGASSTSKSKVQETTKHFIPDHSITCVTQESMPDDDVVACILLIYNPVSKCPVHVHAYRCDSVDTATVLRQHLQQLIDRPENQRKFAELEIRLQAKGLIAPNPNIVGGNDGGNVNTNKKTCNSDGQSIRTESDASGGSSEKDIYALDDRMSNLYDSLAAELREKLNNKRNNGPILLPPRDYDTANQLRGKLPDIEVPHKGVPPATSSALNGSTMKSATSTNAVTGELKKNSKFEMVSGVHGGRTPIGCVEEQHSSGKSSGIGSDEAPSSPTHEREMVGGSGIVGNSGRSSRRPEPVSRETPVRLPEYDPFSARQKNVDHQNTSSDEEWEANRDPQAKTERDMMLVQSPTTARRPLSGGVRGTPFRGQHHSRDRRSMSPHNSHDIPPIVQSSASHRDRYYDRDEVFHRNLAAQVPVAELQRRGGGSNDVSNPARRDVSERLHRLEHMHDRDVEPRIGYRPREMQSPQRRPTSPIHLHDDRLNRREASASRSHGDKNDDRHPAHGSWEIEMGENNSGMFQGSRDLANRRSTPLTSSHTPSYHPQLVTSKSFDDKRHLQKNIDDSMQYRRQQHHDNDSRDHGYPIDSYEHHRGNDRSRDPRRVSSPPASSRAPTSGMPSLIGAPAPGHTADYRGTPAVFRDAYVPLPRIKRIDSGGGGGGSGSHPSTANQSNNNHHQPTSKTSQRHMPNEGDHNPRQSRAFYQELPEEKRFPGLDRSTARLHQHLLMNGSGSTSGHQNGTGISSNVGANGLSGQRYSGTPVTSHPMNGIRSEHQERAPDLRHSSRDRESREWEDARHHHGSSPSKREMGEDRGRRAAYLGGGGSGNNFSQPHYPSSRRSPDHFGSDMTNTNNCHAVGRQQPALGIRQELVRRYVAEDDDTAARNADMDRRFYRYSGGSGGGGGSADPDYRQQHRINSASGYRQSNNNY